MPDEIENPEGKGYQPSPEEIQKAEESMTEAESYLSKAREYEETFLLLTQKEQIERFEKDGGRYAVEGSVIHAKDERLGDIKLFLGVEKVGEKWGEDHPWPFYPVVFLAEDIIKHPRTGEMRVRKGAKALLQGGIGDSEKGTALVRMHREAQAILQGKVKIENLCLFERMNLSLFEHFPNR